MAESKTQVDTDAPVVDTAAAPYKESDDFVPDATAQFGTLDTSGTSGGHHEKLEMVSPIFDAARAQDLQYAARAVDPDDTEVSESSAVVLSTGTTVVQGDPDADRERIRKAAQGYVEEPVEVADPTLKAAEDQAEQTKKDGPEKTADKVEAQQKAASPAGGAK